MTEWLTSWKIGPRESTRTSSEQDGWRNDLDCLAQPHFSISSAEDVFLFSTQGLGRQWLDFLALMFRKRFVGIWTRTARCSRRLPLCVPRRICAWCTRRFSATVDEPLQNQNDQAFHQRERDCETNANCNPFRSSRLRNHNSCDTPVRCFGVRKICGSDSHQYSAS